MRRSPTSPRAAGWSPRPAHVDRARGRPTGVTLALLDDAQELGLDGGRSRRPRRGTACRRARPRTRPAVAVGAGERALHVAEELALDQLPGKRRAVERHERAVPAPALGVDRARGELFAGPALAGHEDGRVRGPARRIVSATYASPANRPPSHGNSPANSRRRRRFLLAQREDLMGMTDRGPISSLSNGLGR